MHNKYRVEFYQWYKDGLNVNCYFFDTDREAMDYSYSNMKHWHTLKVYDKDSVLMHQNKNSNQETYA